MAASQKWLKVLEDFRAQNFGYEYFDGEQLVLEKYDGVHLINAYVNYLKALAKENGWTIKGLPKKSLYIVSGWSISAFIQVNEDKCVRFQTKDFRGVVNEWFDHVCVRRCENERDFRGGINYWTSLPNLVETINSVR